MMRYCDSAIKARSRRACFGFISYKFEPLPSIAALEVARRAKLVRLLQDQGDHFAVGFVLEIDLRTDGLGNEDILSKDTTWSGP
jgi:hypothetical protein